MLLFEICDSGVKISLLQKIAVALAALRRRDRRCVPAQSCPFAGEGGSVLYV